MAAKLRLKISYVQNEVLKWDGEVSMLTAEIKNDAGILSQVRIFIDQLRTPFGFLTREIDETISKVRKERLSEKEAEMQPDHPHYEKEKEMEQKFDMYVGQVAKQYKIETIPWLLVTKVVVWIFLGLTLIQMLKRNCFLSLTVAAVAIYVLENPASISRQTFRGLVLLIACSWVYDFIQIFIIDSSSSEEDEEDGGNEYKLRRFVRLFTWISLIFKLVVVLVFWKDSLDFRNIIRQKKETPDDELNDILAQYEA